MTLKEFYESKKTLALFNDYVVDLTAYSIEHPGGTFLIQQYNKKENWSIFTVLTRWKIMFLHIDIPSLRWRFLKRLIWAKIIPEVELELELDSNRSAARFVDDPNLIEVAPYHSKKVSLFKISSTVEISKNLYRLTFEDNEVEEH